MTGTLFISGLFEMEGSCLDAVIDRCITSVLHVFRVKVLVSSCLFKMAITVTCDVGTRGLEWVVGRVLGWVVGLACARATFNTGMSMIKLLPEHKIVYNSTKFFIDLASYFCCQVHQIDALNFKMCKMFLYIKYIPRGACPGPS